MSDSFLHNAGTLTSSIWRSACTIVDGDEVTGVEDEFEGVKGTLPKCWQASRRIRSA